MKTSLTYVAVVIIQSIKKRVVIIQISFANLLQLRLDEYLAKTKGLDEC